MTRRSRRRPIILVILAGVLGALLAFIPRPSLSVVREMRAQTDTPLVSSVSAPAAGVVAHKEGIAEFRMIGVTWAGAAADAGILSGIFRCSVCAWAAAAARAAASSCARASATLAACSSS